MSGCQEGLGERKERGLPNRRGLIVLMGGVQKARQKSGTWEAGQVSAFSARAQCWRGHSATACPPLALGEPVTHEPLARAPSETRTTARLSHSNPPFLGPNWPASSEPGAQFLLTPQQHVVAPLHLRARAAGGTAGWTVGGCVKVGGPAATPVKNTKNKQKKNQEKKNQHLK